MTADIQFVARANTHLHGCKGPLARAPDSSIMAQGCVFLARFTVREPLSAEGRCQHSGISRANVFSRGKRAQMFLGFPHEWCMTYRVQPICCSSQSPASDTAQQGDKWYFLLKYCLCFTEHFLLNSTIYRKFNTKSLPSVKFIFLLWIVTAAIQPVCSDCKCIFCCCCTVVHISDVMS